MSQKDTRTFYSICGSCGYFCPIEGEIHDNKIKKIRGVRNHPVTQGRLCSKGNKYPETIDHPDRVLSPLQQENQTWTKVSWDVAIAQIGKHIKAAVKQYGSSAVAIITGRGTGEWFDPHYLMARRFADALQTPNYFSLQGVCWCSRAMAEIYTVGSLIHISTQGIRIISSDPPSYCPSEIVPSRYILVYSK